MKPLVLNRIISIDVMRGLAIFAMVLVNNPGSWQAVYWPLRHAKWHGVTPTDFIFPAFIFIMGVTMAIHLPNELKRTGSYWRVISISAWRAMMLVLLGWLLNLFWVDFSEPQFDWWQERVLQLRFMGVLPRLGLVYFISVCVVLLVGQRNMLIGLISTALLCIYYLLMNYVPYNDADGNTYQGLWLFGNSLAAYIDNAVLGESHVYYADASPFAFDPEGLLSTISAVVTCLTGVMVGRHVYVQYGCANQLMTAAIMATCLGAGLAVINPINKALWSPTFVLVTSGLLTVLLWLVVLVERKSRAVRQGHPLLVAGMNSIAFFMLSGVMARLLLMLKIDNKSLKSWVFEALNSVLPSAEIASLSYAILFTLVCYIPIRILYNHSIFWRL